MEHYDPQKAQQIWTRIRSESEKFPPPLQKYLLAEMQFYADLGRLQYRFPETKALLSQCSKNIACLQGILFLTDGSRSAPVMPKPQDSSVENLLRRCIGQQLKFAADYTSLADHPEFGCIYSQLAATKRRHCRILLELLGREDKAYLRK